MAQDIVGGLFGGTTQDVYNTYATQDRANAIALMNSPTKNQMGIFYGSQIGSNLGRAAAGLLGAEDPRLTQAKQIDQVKQWIAQSGIDMNTPEGLAQAAQYAQSIGAVEGAMYLGQQSLAKRKETSAIAKTEEDYMREKAFREEVSKIPPEQLTEEVLMQLAAKYGTTASVMSAMASLTGKREAIASREAAAQDKLDLKKQAAEEKTLKAQQNAYAAIGPILDTLDKTIPMISSTTAGLGGWAMGMLPGTSARDLKANIETIKANLGFQQLQAMRDASPTGGALGQVAVQELKALQSTVSSLDPEQSPAQLKANMKKVQEHYQNWRKTLEGQMGYSNAPTTAPTNVAAPQSAGNDPLGIR